jgi:hypothetical protein
LDHSTPISFHRENQKHPQPSGRDLEGKNPTHVWSLSVKKWGNEGTIRIDTYKNRRKLHELMSA